LVLFIIAAITLDDYGTRRSLAILKDSQHFKQEAVCLPLPAAALDLASLALVCEFSNTT